MPERLQKILAGAGVASRRAAEKLITAGRVAVDGVTVCELGTRADAATQRITVDGKPIAAEVQHLYLVLNKPSGYVTTRSDRHAERTVMDIVTPELEAELGKGNPTVRGLHPVGRLDADSQGLLLLTNDGAFTQLLTHPKHQVPKTYVVTVKGIPDDDDLQKLRSGIPLFGRRTAPARVRLIRSDRITRRAMLEIELREGRNRQVRRMLQSLGHPAVKVTRVSVGAVHLGRLRPGQWRRLSEQELQSLRAAALEQPRPRKSAPDG